MRTIKILGVCGVLCILVLASCSSIPRVLYGKQIAGQAVDADTGQPLSGVHVAYVWESVVIPRGFTGHNSQTVCYHAAAAVTDANGRFVIAPWREWSTYRVLVMDPIALVYARDYQPRQIALLEGSAEAPVEHLNERYELKRFSGSANERLDAMWGGIANRGCMYGKESQKSLFPMLKAMYEEARSIAITDIGRQRVYFFGVMAAESALALDPNGPARSDYVDKFIAEQLK